MKTTSKLQTMFIRISRVGGVGFVDCACAQGLATLEMHLKSPSAYLRNFFRSSGEMAWLSTRGSDGFCQPVDERVRERLRRTGDVVKQCLDEVDRDL